MNLKIQIYTHKAKTTLILDNYLIKLEQQCEWHVRGLRFKT